MKTPLFASVVMLLALATTLQGQSRFVTLVIGGANVLDEVAIGTNEVASIKGSFDSNEVGTGSGASFVEVAKGNQVMRLGTPQLSPGWGAYRGPVAIAGPARFSLKYLGPMGPSSTAFLTVEIQPESFPPDKTIIIPADTKGANILMEASADLIHWTNAPPGLYTNQTANLFFRLRAERIP